MQLVKRDKYFSNAISKSALLFLVGIIVFLSPFDDFFKYKVGFFMLSPAKIVLSLVFVVYVLRGEFSLAPKSTLLLAFILSVLCSFVFVSENRLLTLVIILSLVGYFVFYQVLWVSLNDENDFVFILKSYCIPVIIFAVMVLLLVLLKMNVSFSPNHRLYSNVYGVVRVNGFFSNPNQLGLVVMPAFIYAYISFLKSGFEKNIFLMLLWFVLFLLLFLVAALSGSRAAVGGEISGVIFANIMFIAISKLSIFKRIIYISLFFAVWGGLLYMVVYMLPGLVAHYFSSTHSHSHEASRYVLMKSKSIRIHVEEVQVGFKAMSKHLVSGVGAGGLGVEMQSNGFSKSLANNTFLSIAASYGLPALLFFCIIICHAMYRVFRCVIRAGEKDCYLPIMLFSTLITYLIYSLGHTEYVLLSFWLIVFMSFSYDRYRLSEI